MKCLMCKKELQLMDFDKRPVSRASAVDDGGTVEISFGYGSRHDCRMALGFICDDCFEQNQGLFTNHYDGLAPQPAPPPPEEIRKPDWRVVFALDAAILTLMLVVALLIAYA